MKHDIDGRTVLRLILERNGYGGLCNARLDCWCEKDSLVPCGHLSNDCEPVQVAANNEDRLSALIDRLPVYSYDN